MNTKIILGLSVVVACAVTGMYVTSHQKAASPDSIPAPVIKIESHAATAPAQVAVAPAPPEIIAELPAAVKPVPAKPAAARSVAQIQSTANPAPSKKAPAQDPDARVALSLVGADPEAETYWFGAITDPNLPDQEREDLMEDLNEDGLSDPKHPSPEDMVLIANRIQLIEQIMPSADGFMQEHLGEAYKDLNNLLAGGPVN